MEEKDVPEKEKIEFKVTGDVVLLSEDDLTPLAPPLEWSFVLKKLAG